MHLNHKVLLASLVLSGVLVDAHGHAGHSHDHSHGGALSRSDQNLNPKLKQALRNVIDTSDVLKLKSSLVKDLEKAYDELKLEDAEAVPETGKLARALANKLFAYTPRVNGLLAVLASALSIAVLIQLSPPLSGALLAFLVSFAGGGMLGNVFLHLVPEIFAGGNTSHGYVLIFGFVFFCAVEKGLGLIMRGLGAEPHTHSHGHSHSHSHSHGHSHKHDHKHDKDTKKSDRKTSPSKSSKSDQDTEKTTRRRKSVSFEDEASSAVVSSSKAEPAELKHRSEKSHRTKTRSSTEPKKKVAAATLSRSAMVAIVNVIGDFLHNVTDGFVLASAFSISPEVGAQAFVFALLHEIPHQLGDFALLVKGGASRATGAKAQLIGSGGTLLGYGLFCLLEAGLMSHASLESAMDFTMPFTAGVFLFIATVGIIPEILEADAELSTRQQFAQSMIQAAGIFCGVVAVAAMS